jgi:hypothetical protein
LGVDFRIHVWIDQLAVTAIKEDNMATNYFNGPIGKVRISGIQAQGRTLTAEAIEGVPASDFRTLRDTDNVYYNGLYIISWAALRSKSTTTIAVI